MADRGEHQPGRQHAQAAVDGTGELDCLDPVPAENPSRSEVVGQPDTRPLGCRAERILGGRQCREDLQRHPPRRVDRRSEVAEHRCPVGGPDHDLGAGGQVDQLGQGECRLCGTATGRDNHLAHRGSAQHLKRRDRDIGSGKGFRLGDQQAGDVEGDVAVADDHHPLMAEINGRLGVVGVPVDPRHGLRRGRAAVQRLTRDVEPAGPRRSDRVQHRMVVIHEIGVRHLPAHLHVEVDAEAVPPADPVEEPGDRPGALMIRRDAAPHQAVGRGHPFEDVDADPALGE